MSNEEISDNKSYGGDNIDRESSEAGQGGGGDESVHTDTINNTGINTKPQKEEVQQKRLSGKSILAGFTNGNTSSEGKGDDRIGPTATGVVVHENEEEDEVEIRRKNREFLRRKFDEFLKESKIEDNNAKYEDAIGKLKQLEEAERFNLIPRRKENKTIGLIILPKHGKSKSSKTLETNSKTLASNDNMGESENSRSIRTTKISTLPQRRRSDKVSNEKVKRDPEDDIRGSNSEEMGDQGGSNRQSNKIHKPMASDAPKTRGRPAGTTKISQRAARNTTSKLSDVDKQIMGLANKVDNLWKHVVALKQENTLRQVKKQTKKDIENYIAAQKERENPKSDKDLFFERLDAATSIAALKNGGKVPSHQILKRLY